MDNVEAIIKAVGNCGSVYKAVHLAVKRTQELTGKEKLLGEAKEKSPQMIALEEIAEGKIKLGPVSEKKS